MCYYIHNQHGMVENRIASRKSHVWKKERWRRQVPTISTTCRVDLTVSWEVLEAVCKNKL